jgi:hypothetical protein
LRSSCLSAGRKYHFQEVRRSRFFSVARVPKVDADCFIYAEIGGGFDVSRGCGGRRCGHVPRQLTHRRELVKNSVARNERAYCVIGARRNTQEGIPNPSHCALTHVTSSTSAEVICHAEGPYAEDIECHAACERPQPPSLRCYLCCNEEQQERERESVLMFSFAAELFCSTLASF